MEENQSNQVTGTIGTITGYSTIVGGRYSNSLGQGAPVAPNVNINKIKDITIRALDFGYMVNVGCQSVAVETKEKLIQKLADYINNPLEINNTWFSSTGKEKFMKD